MNLWNGKKWQWTKSSSTSSHMQHPRDNDWPTSLGSCNGKAYDTALALQWMQDFLNSTESLKCFDLCKVLHYTLVLMEMIGFKHGISFSRVYILRTVQLMIYFKGWRLQWQQPIPSSALCGHVECGLGSHTGLKLWRLAHWCASLALKLTCFIIFSRATNSQHICLSVIYVILFFWCYLGRERFPYLERKPMGIWQPKPMRKAWSFSASDPRSIFSSTSTSTWLLGILPFRHWATGHVWSYF